HDGKVIPKEVALALAKGARARGATVLENVRVLEVLHRDGRAVGVRAQFSDSVAADASRPTSTPSAEREARDEDRSLVTSAATVEIKAEYVVLTGGMWTREL